MRRRNVVVNTTCTGIRGSWLADGLAELAEAAGPARSAAVIVIFDGQDGTAGRKDTDPGYKATRPGGSQALLPIPARSGAMSRLSPVTRVFAL